MNMNRLWILGAVMLIGVVVVLGWMLGISPKLVEARAAKADQVLVESQNAAFEAQLATLKAQFESIDELRSELSGLRESVPTGAHMPAFVGQLGEIAAAHKVTLSAITVSDAQPYVPVVAAPPAPAAPAEPAPAPAEGAAADDPAAAAPMAAPAPVAPAPVVNALVTAANFVAIPIALSVDGKYDDVLDFVEGLQLGKRLVMVTTFNTSAAESGKVTGTINAFVYVLLDPQADALVETG